MEMTMERATFHKIATPVDRFEYRKWARVVTVVYGVLFVAGIGFAMAHRYQSPQRSIALDTPPITVTALNQFHR
jgi:hypothetical protein